MFFARSCTVKMSWFSQDLRLWKPCWASWSILCTSRCRMMLLPTICSSILHVKSKNSNDPRTILWGTPDWTGAVLEVTPSSNTCFVRPQGSPLSTREYCYGRHSNWFYIEGAYVVLYRMPSKSPGVLGLSGPDYWFSLQGPALSRWAGSRRIFVWGSHVERHGVLCAHPGVEWCCCILFVPPGPVSFGTCICSNVETILSLICHVYGPFEFGTSLGTSILPSSSILHVTEVRLTRRLFSSLLFSPILKIGTTFAVFLSLGNCPWSRDAWMKSCSMGAISFIVSFSVRHGMLSGPVALCICRLVKIL